MFGPPRPLPLLTRFFHRPIPPTTRTRTPSGFARPKRPPAVSARSRSTARPPTACRPTPATFSATCTRGRRASTSWCAVRSTPRAAAAPTASPGTKKFSKPPSKTSTPFPMTAPATTASPLRVPAPGRPAAATCAPPAPPSTTPRRARRCPTRLSSASTKLIARSFTSLGWRERRGK